VHIFQELKRIDYIMQGAEGSLNGRPLFVWSTWHCLTKWQDLRTKWLLGKRLF